MTPPLVGGAFTSNWNDLTVGDLFDRIRTTMPLDAPGRLPRPQTADVVAFLLKANGWPSGATELAPDPPALKQIRIEAARLQ
jgi:S-disulfanyl-L-cysteine oxidoreductase SoxD